MNLVITADWPITDLERMEAEQAIRVAFSEILPLANLALEDLSSEPWDAYTGTLEIFLHATTFDNRSGQTHWSAPGADSKIEVAWDVQHQEGQAPLRHEFGHWLALQAGHEHWGEFGHLTPTDPLMKALKGALKTAYFGNAGAAFLGFKKIDFSKPEFVDMDLDFKFKVISGELDCEVFDKGLRVDFTKDELKRWLWEVEARAGKLRVKSFDKDKET